MPSISTIYQAKDLLKKGVINTRTLIEKTFDTIAERDGELHTYLRTTKDQALDKAKEADARYEQGKARALEGIPICIKDNILTKGIETTAGAKLLKGFIPPYSATVVERLEAAGAIIIGKNNCDAWAHGSSTENSDYGPTKNPWDPTRVPGGSSGGSAAAVAAGMGLASIGTDTGGSIRQPAAFCGITGFKPTYGRLSRYGLVAMASSLDCPGPLARTARDAALLTRIMSGVDANDSTSLPQKKVNLPNVAHNLPLKGIKIGLPQEYFDESLDADIKQLVYQAIEELKNLGAETQTINLPTMPYALTVYYVIQPAEVSSNLARYDGIRYGLSQINAETSSKISRRSGNSFEMEKARAKIKNAQDLIIANRTAGFGAEAKRRIIMGTFVLSSGYFDAHYKRAMQVRTKIIEDFHRVFNEVDLIITPTTPRPAFEFGAKADPLSMYLEDIYTVSANIAGLPTISVPCGFINRGSDLPAGLQIMGPQLADEQVLYAAMAYQTVTDWHTKKPGV